MIARRTSFDLALLGYFYRCEFTVVDGQAHQEVMRMIRQDLRNAYPDLEFDYNRLYGTNKHVVDVRNSRDWRQIRTFIAARQVCKFDAQPKLVYQPKHLKQSFEMDKTIRWHTSVLHLCVQFEPLDDADDILYVVSDDVQKRLRMDQIEAFWKGLLHTSITNEGWLTGYRVLWEQMSIQQVPTGQAVFLFAAEEVMREVCSQARAVPVEPVLLVNIYAPEKYLDAIQHELATRAESYDNWQDGDKWVISAFITMMRFFDYEETLLRFTDQQGTCTLQFAGYKKP